MTSSMTNPSSGLASGFGVSSRWNVIWCSWRSMRPSMSHSDSTIRRWIREDRQQHASRRYEVEFPRSQDFGIWIDEGERPVPRRLVITYPQAAKSPQFRASFLSWDFSPDTGDARFRFEAPDGAKRVPWAALGEVQKLLTEGR